MNRVVSTALLATTALLALTADPSGHSAVPGDDFATTWKRCPPIANEFADSTCVFVGKVVSSKKLWEPDDFIRGTFYYVRVGETIKGAPPSTVQLYTANDSGRFWMDVGVTYLVFASPDKFDGVDHVVLSVLGCGNSGDIKLKKDALEEVHRLRKATQK